MPTIRQSAHYALLVLAISSLTGLANAAATKTGPNGVFANSLCLNAVDKPGVETYQHIESILGPGAVEALGDEAYTPPLKHISMESDQQVGPHFAFFGIYPTDTAGRFNDRSRTEIKFPPEGVDTYKAREGQTFTYQWRFKLAKNMKLSPSFGHVHQIKAFGGQYADPPLITFTPLLNGSMEVRQVGNKMKNSNSAIRLGKMSMEGLMGEWLDVSEQITYANPGRYLLSIKTLDGREVLHIDKSGLEMWRDGADHMRPKWGLYRKYHDALLYSPEEIAQGKNRDYVYFANIGITVGDKPASCR